MKLYIALMHTGTPLTRIIKFLTHEEFTHCVFSFDKGLNKIYCIGLNNPNSFIPRGAFVEEDTSNDFFKKHSKAPLMVIPIEITKEQNKKLLNAIEHYKQKKIRYNVIGMITAFFNIKRTRKDHLYCSEFLTNILQEAGIEIGILNDGCARPNDFKYLIGPNNKDNIYRGTIQEYKKLICETKRKGNSLRQRLKTKPNPRIKRNKPSTDNIKNLNKQEQEI